MMNDYQRQDRESWGRRTGRRAVGAADAGGSRTLAAVAHGAIAFGLFGIGFLVSLAITGIIWLYGRHSPYLREQADRAGRYQLLVLALNILVVALWIGGVALFFYLGGWGGWGDGGWRSIALTSEGVLLLLAVPVFVVWYFGTIGFGLYAALRALAGHDFRYPIIDRRR
ncbi:MAG: DUF4870 domain-containing protein [Thermomicrobiales bacterium]